MYEYASVVAPFSKSSQTSLPRPGEPISTSAEMHPISA